MVKDNIQFGDTTKHPVGRMAGLCGARSDMAALVACALAWAFPFRNRVVFFPHPYWISHHTDSPERAREGGIERWKMAGENVSKFSETANGTRLGALLRGHAIRDLGGRSRHPPTLGDLLRALIEFSHGIHG